MEKVRPWCGQPSDRRRLKNRREQISKAFSTTQLNRQACGWRAHEIAAAVKLTEASNMDDH